MMKKLVFAASAVIILTVSLFAVSTKYLGKISFTNIREITFSNVTFVDDGTLELARRTTTLYSSDALLWSFAKTADGFLVGTGDTASLIRIGSRGEEKVFSMTNFMMFSDIETAGDKIWLAAIPQATVFRLDSAYRVEQTFTLSNRYVWDLVPSGGSVYALTGSPAAVYRIDSRSVELLVTLSNDDNLLKGEMFAGDLYFCGDTTLYKWNGTRLSALASFDTTIADFAITGGAIFVATASRDAASVSGRPNEQNQAVTTRPDAGRTGVFDKSALYKVNFTGTVEKVFETSDAKFLALSAIAGNLIVGVQKDGGYYEISPDGSRKAFTSLGSGKFVAMTQDGDSVYAVMTSPSRIVRIDREYAHEGYAVSQVFDLKNVSKFGNPILVTENFPGCSLEMSARSSVVRDDSCWTPWQVVSPASRPDPGRFYQYRVTLRSSGQSTPRLTDIAVPYVELNLAPHIKSVTYTPNAGYMNVKWDTDDANRDQLRFDVYLSREGGEWVRLNRQPLDVTSFNIYYQSFPSGHYRLKLTVSDAVANPASEGLTGYLTGDTFLIDNDPPVITGFDCAAASGKVSVTFSANDALSPILAADYTVNGTDWIKLLPKDQIYDSSSEQFEFRTPVVVPAFVQVRVTDISGNSAVAGAFVR